MQVLVSLPEAEELIASGGINDALFRKICGIPLLTRVIVTAQRSGGNNILVLYPKSLPKDRFESRLDGLPIHIQYLEMEQPFDPARPADWRAIEGQLEERFLWLPWNYVTDRRTLAHLVERGRLSDNGVRFGWPQQPDSSTLAGFQQPQVIHKNALLAGVSLEEVALQNATGIAVTSNQSAAEAERELVRRSGKETDGIFSTFNRRLCRPLVRWLSKTPVTPNLITFSGLFVVLLSGYWYAQGYWLAYALGGLFYFLSVLFDEMDGMLARLTFKDSAFGCWLETVVDYTSYVVVFLGMAVGLYRESGVIWLLQGGLLLTGALLSFFVLGHQRKLATEPDKPNEYLIRIQRRLEADSGNPLSRFARLSEFVIRKAFLSHCIPIFSILGGLKVFFFISAFGSHLVWMLGLYFNRFFRHSGTLRTSRAAGMLTAFGQTKESN